MVYTLAAPAPYGTSYQVQLQGAQDLLGVRRLGRLIQPFGRFKSRARSVYLGVEGEEQGRLVLYTISLSSENHSHPQTLSCS